jgi:rubrerythrin
MNPVLLEKVLQAMETMVEAELAVGQCYQACADSREGEAAFWLQLAREEEQHARSVRRIMEILTLRPEEFRPVQSFSPDAACLFRDQARQQEKDFRGGILTFPRMLRHLVEMENSLLESRYFKIVESDDPEFTHLLSLMVEQTRQHHQKLEQKAAQVYSAPETD